MKRWHRAPAGIVGPALAVAAYPNHIFFQEHARFKRACLHGLFAAEKANVLALLVLPGLLRWTAKPYNRRMGAGMVHWVSDAHDFDPLEKCYGLGTEEWKK